MSIEFNYVSLQNDKEVMSIEFNYVSMQNDKEVMSSEFNYVSMQNGTTFYLLNFVHYSWTIALNFENAMLNQLNLIRAKERTLSSLDPHQNVFVKSNLLWEMGDSRED
jgi:hypothetical protein